MENENFMHILHSMKDVYKIPLSNIYKEVEKPSIINSKYFDTFVQSIEELDDIQRYFEPIYDRIQKEMDEISRYYNRLYRKQLNKSENKYYSEIHEKASFMERIMYKSDYRISDDEVVYRFKTHKWLSDRDIHRINKKSLIPGIHVSLY